MTQSLWNLVSKFLSADPDLTGVDIADALWLAKFLPSSANQEDEKSGEQGSSATSFPSSSDPTPTTTSTSIPQTPIFIEPPRSSNTYLASDSVPAVAVQSPKGSALPNQREIELALRPLKQRTPSRIEFELDEEATAENFAEQYLAGMRILSPVLHPIEKRWLEVALIVDCSNSMVIWQETARELERLLARQGFRDVHLWHIDTQNINIEPHSKVALKVLPFKHNYTTRQTSSSRKLIPCKDCLLLVLSDCVAPAWQNRHIFPLLAEWGKRTSVTLLQVWSERLWSRTILRDISCFVSARQPASQNVLLTAERWPNSFEEKSSGHGLLIPVVELEPNALADWARMITGVRDVWLPALDVSNFPSSTVETENEQPVPAKQRDLQEWVELFKATASPLAQRLAGLLASTPLTLSVMRLVQNALLPEAKLAHLAEVLTSGLIYRVVDNESSIADEPFFDFIPGARNLLRLRVTVSDTLEVLEKVGEFISRKAGQGEGFAALVPSVAGTEFILNKQTLPFARIEKEVLNSLGPIYRPLAQQLDEQIARFEEDIFQKINGEIGDRLGEANTLQAISEFIAENLQSAPNATVEELVERLKADNRIIQINTENARAFQTLVEEGGIANLGVHLHDFDEEKLGKVIKALWKSLQPAEIPNNVPRSGVVKFIGRELDLKKLHTQLQQGNLVAISAIEGMLGVGKTELAIQYTQQYQSDYAGGICWLFARGREFDIGTQVVHFAQSQLSLKIPEGLELSDQVAFCWRNWREGDVLLVLDDVDVVNYSHDLNPYLPPSSSNRFKVLMTTRLKFGPPIQSISLDVLSEEQSLELLVVLIGLQRVEQELDIAKTLCQWLGYLPLGIEFVGRYLRKRTDLSLSTLLFRLEQKAQKRLAIKHDSLQLDEATRTSTAKPRVEAAFDLSWEELDENSQHLGKRLSLFAPLPIPWSLIEAAEQKYFENSDDGREFNVEELEKARIELLNLHFLQLLQQQTYFLHPLIREFFRSKLEDKPDITTSGST